MQLSSVIEGFLFDKTVSCSPHTISDYRNTTKQFLAFQGDVPIDQITSDHIRRFLFYLRVERKLRPKTVRNAWICLSSIWTWLEKEMNLPHVVRNVAAPPATQVQIQPFSKVEIKAMLGSVERTAVWQGPKRAKADSKRPTFRRDKTIILMLLDTGLRAQELCNLLIGDVNLETGAIHVRSGKGDKDRIVYMGALTRQSLWRYLNKDRKFKEPRDPLFSTNKFGPMDSRALARMLERTARRAGIQDKSNPHRFRHTFAITYLRNGGDVYTLQRLLGHNTLDMVKRYLAIAEVDLEHAHRQASPVDNWRLG